MVNHPNRSKWTRDGDQWIFKGSLGTYRITEWVLSGGSNFAISFKSRSSSEAEWKGIGEFSSLANAKSAVETYDGYRNTAA